MPYFQLPHRQWRLLVQNCHWKGSLVRGFSDPNGVSDLLAPAEISHCIREAMPSALPHATPPDPILIQVARSPPQEQIATCCRLIIAREDGGDPFEVPDRKFARRAVTTIRHLTTSQNNVYL